MSEHTRFVVVSPITAEFSFSLRLFLKLDKMRTVHVFATPGAKPCCGFRTSVLIGTSCKAHEQARDRHMGKCYYWCLVAVEIVLAFSLSRMRSVILSSRQGFNICLTSLLLKASTCLTPLTSVLPHLYDSRGVPLLFFILLFLFLAVLLASFCTY